MNYGIQFALIVELIIALRKPSNDGSKIKSSLSYRELFVVISGTPYLL